MLSQKREAIPQHFRSRANLRRTPLEMSTVLSAVARLSAPVARVYTTIATGTAPVFLTFHRAQPLRERRASAVPCAHARKSRITTLRGAVLGGQIAAVAKNELETVAFAACVAADVDADAVANEEF